MEGLDCRHASWHLRGDDDEEEEAMRMLMMIMGLDQGSWNTSRAWKPQLLTVPAITCSEI